VDSCLCAFPKLVWVGVLVGGGNMGASLGGGRLWSGGGGGGWRGDGSETF
jgi:hypothetical protein